MAEMSDGEKKEPSLEHFALARLSHFCHQPRKIDEETQQKADSDAMSGMWNPKNKYAEKKSNSNSLYT